MSTTTSRRGLTKPATTDPVSLLRTSIGALADVVEGAVVSVKDPAFGAVGDGTTDNTTAIQAAATAAAGGTLLIPLGTYKVTATVTIPSNTTVRGEGHGSIVKLTGTATANIFKNSDFVAGNTDITVQDLTIDRSGSTTTDPDDTCIWFRYVTRATIKGVRLRGASKCIRLEGCERYKVTGNDADTFGDCAISVNEPAGVGAASASNPGGLVAGNTLVQGTTAVSSLIVATESNCRIIGNELLATIALTGYGVEVGAVTSVGSSQIVVANNSFRGCGVLVGNGDRHVVRGNDLTDGGFAGSAKIVCQPTGSDSPVVTRCYVEGNNIFTNTAGTLGGIKLITSPFSRAVGNLVTGLGAVITVQSNDCDVQANTVEGASARGIWALSVSRVRIVGNTCRDCGQDAAGSDTTKVGYTLDTLTDATIDGNLAISSKVATADMHNGYYVNASTGIIWRNNLSRGHTVGIYTTSNTQTWQSPGSVPSIASAATIVVPQFSDVFNVSGTTTITSVTATGQAGRVVTLIFAGALTFTDGSNLKLAGNFVTTADDAITLACDGTNWTELARSVN
jgi:nitrous oxidase accessory protein NosD